ncbi:MAG: hypothetical protein ACKV2T_05725 [Kofleriaceae bacterium]
MSSAFVSMSGYALVFLLAACKDKAPDPKPASGAPAAVASGSASSAPAGATGSANPAPAGAAAPGEDFAGPLNNLGMWSEMNAYCGWNAEPFKDLKTRLFAVPTLAAARADLETYFDRGAAYGKREADKRAEQKAKGEAPSAWACGADVEASVLQEIARLTSAK